MNVSQFVAAAMGERRRCVAIIRAQADFAIESGELMLYDALNIIAAEMERGATSTGTTSEESTARRSRDDQRQEASTEEEDAARHRDDDPEEEEREALGIIGRARVARQLQGIPRDSDREV